MHAYRTRFDPVLHFAFVHGSIGDGRDVPARLHRADILNDIFGGGAIDRCLKRFKEEGRGVLVYLRDGSAGVPLNIPAAPARLRRTRGSRCGAKSASARRSCAISA